APTTVLVYAGRYFFFSSRRRHTRFSRDWSSDVCSSDLGSGGAARRRCPTCWSMRLSRLARRREQAPADRLPMRGAPRPFGGQPDDWQVRQGVVDAEKRQVAPGKVLLQFLQGAGVRQVEPA